MESGVAVARQIAGCTPLHAVAAIVAHSKSSGDGIKCLEIVERDMPSANNVPTRTIKIAGLELRTSPENPHGVIIDPRAPPAPPASPASPASEGKVKIVGGTGGGGASRRGGRRSTRRNRSRRSNRSRKH